MTTAFRARPPRRSRARASHEPAHRLAGWWFILLSACGETLVPVAKPDSLPEYHAIVVCALRRGEGPPIAVHYALVEGDPDPVETASNRARSEARNDPRLRDERDASTVLHERCWRGAMKDAFLHLRRQKFVTKPALVRSRRVLP